MIIHAVIASGAKQSSVTKPGGSATHFGGRLLRRLRLLAMTVIGGMLWQQSF
jgi:hypothetical protein